MRALAKFQCQSSGPFMANKHPQRVSSLFCPVNTPEFCLGLAVELEYVTMRPYATATQEDLVAAGRIVAVNINKIPDYYSRLAKLETHGIYNLSTKWLSV